MQDLNVQSNYLRFTSFDGADIFMNFNWSRANEASFRDRYTDPRGLGHSIELSPHINLQPASEYAVSLPASSERSSFQHRESRQTQAHGDEMLQNFIKWMNDFIKSSNRILL